MVTLTIYPNNTPNTRLLYSILCSVSLYSVLYVLCTICVYHAITGAQAFSQHPNYFGNVALWSGILLMNTPALLAAGGAGRGGRHDSPSPSAAHSSWGLCFTAKRVGRC